MKLRMIIITAVFFLSMVMVSSLYANEKEFMIHNSADIKTLLQQHVGKTVTLGLNSGAEIIGMVTKVGDHLVQLSRPPRKEFYDVIIRLDRINSLMIKVRDR